MKFTLILLLLMLIVFYVPLIYIIVLIVKALRKYLKSSDVRKEKIETKFNQFYISKMDWLYKGILKNYSIKLAENVKVYERNNLI